VVSCQVPVVIARTKPTKENTVQLGGYLEKIELGTDHQTGLPNILVESAAEYHALPVEDKRRAWALVKVATELLHLGPVAVYQQAAEGKIISQTIKKNTSDKKGLTFIQIEPALSDHTQARQKDKDRVIRRLRRVLRGTWWLNTDSEQVLTFIVGLELNRVEAAEFGSLAKKAEVAIEQYKTLEWLADTYRAAITAKFGAEEAAKLIAEHVTPYDKWLEAKKTNPREWDK
jgi:hypothetical protein